MDFISEITNTISLVAVLLGIISELLIKQAYVALGPFLGVFIAFGLARIYDRYSDVQKRAKWLEVVRTEIIVFYPTYETYDRYAKPDQTDIYI
jgi:hypothetical protein